MSSRYRAASVAKCLPRILALRCLSVMVANRTDRCLSFERATELAQVWGISLADAGVAPREVRGQF